MTLPRIPTLAEIQNQKRIQKENDERRRQERKEASKAFLPKMLNQVIKDLDSILDGYQCYVDFGADLYNLDVDACVELLNEQFKLQNADYLIAKCENDFHSGFPMVIVRKKINE